jgi:pimeloyl-ACP methyl ester carboxylesterase
MLRTRFFPGDITAVLLPVLLLAAVPTTSILRSDHFVQSADDVRIYIRKVVTGDARQMPILLLHGGSPPGEIVFDINVPGYSLAEDLVRAGYRVYIMDVRGWGKSVGPPSAVFSAEALEDVEAAVEWIRKDSGTRQIALLGHATGGHWAGMYAARHPQNIAKLVMVNSMYGVEAPWPLAAGFEDPQHPGRFNESGGLIRFADAAGLLAGWNRSIPTEDKSTWRDPRVAEAYVRDGLATDPTSSSRNPPSMRIPGAFRLEHYEMARGKKFWDAHDIQAPTLYVRGTRDHWSRAADLDALKRDLTNAPAQFISIPDATHFVFLDRPDHGRTQFMKALLQFLASRPRP